MPIEQAPRAYEADQTLEMSEKRAPLREYGMNYRVDPTVSFAEFRYWAKVEREEEREAERLYLERRGPMTMTKAIKGRFSKGVHHDNKKMDQQDATRTGPSTEEKGGSEHAGIAGRFKSMFGRSSGADGHHNHDNNALTASASNDKTAHNVAHGASSDSSLDEEWKTASRALRTAGWSSIFFLVTTDILGWSNTPYVSNLPKHCVSPCPICAKR